jgi:alanyl-tRNA synthetase
VATEKLYWADPFLSSFEAPGARLSRLGDRPSIVLSRTAFYPEGGGQLADTGSLDVGGRVVAISDVQIDDAGEIHHLFEGDLELDERASVKGSIEPARRRDHMAQHTAQHMLSRALVDVARADTVSARLGRGSCTIDVDLGALADRALGQIEDLVNAVVRDDVPVRALYPTAGELAAMKLRRAPKVTEGVRVIDVEGFDLTPCGGTHCTRTGQIGAVSIAGTESYKGKLRVSFHAAGRAIADARATAGVLQALAAELTCGPLDVPLVVGKMRGELKARTDLLSATRGELVELLAERTLAAHPVSASGTTRIVMVRPRDDLAMLRTLAGRLASRPDVVAFCGAPEDADLLVVVQRGASASFNAGAWLKATAAAHGGRGGGRPERAEGRLPGTVDLSSLAGSG